MGKQPRWHHAEVASSCEPTEDTVQAEPAQEVDRQTVEVAPSELGRLGSSAGDTLSTSRGGSAWISTWGRWGNSTARR